MPYFAKSKEKQLSISERERLDGIFQNLLKNLDQVLLEKEKIILENSRKNLLNASETSQKTLSEHVTEVVQCAEIFFQQYGQYFTEKEKVLILTACNYHDLGKVNDLFQILVNPESAMKNKSMTQKQIPHGFLSALSISKKELINNYPEITAHDFQVLTTAIYYHHAREDGYNDRQIKEYCEKYYNENVKKYLDNPSWKINYFNRSGRLFENNDISVPKNIPDNLWNEYLVVKGLLNKFDWAASAGYEDSEVQPDLTDKKLVKNIMTNLSKGLRPAQQYMQEHREDNLVIIAPTGSGKTEAALLWINGEKAFYTLPLKVSSNAIYKRIKEAYSFENAALLHSDSMKGYLEEAAEHSESGGYEKYEKARLLSAPLTVSTVDQLFKFVYKALGTEIFAATLKYSKVVLDEIQAYSPRVVATLIYGLKTISQLGGRFAIITATFPPVLKDFMERYGLIAENQYQIKDFSSSSKLQRHMISLKGGEIDIEEIVRQSDSKKVLIICNTVSKAQEIYEKVYQETENTYLLHSRFVRRDRDILEEMIMQFSLDKDSKGVWITTQIVEASLDIDFDILFTEMCTCDSLLQRMGRCNRAGRYLPTEPNVIIYDSRNGVKTIYDPVLYDRSREYIIKYENTIFTEEMKVFYINQVYKTDEINDTAYYKEIENFLEHFDQIRPLEYDKQEADEQFRLIKSIAVVPDTIYNRYQNLFEEIREFLKQPHIGREAKSILKTKLNSLTLGINLYHNRFPEGVDRRTIEGTNIYRTQLKYEFDSEVFKGRGLILDQLEDESCFI